jgi:hypothetical protein
MNTARFLAPLALLSFASAATIAFGLTACESATNLDVTYGDAASALEASASADADPDAIANAGEGGTSTPAPAAVTGCPCDESAGVGCCIPSGGGSPFCTADTSLCAQQKGAYLRCEHPDPITESVCCWHPATSDDGTGVGTVAALAGACNGGPTACLVASDCAGSGQTGCTTVVCRGITIGACGATPPVCPP